MVHPRLANVGSESSKSMGKQSSANFPSRASSVQQPPTLVSMVRERSWSRNWPNCITIRVACRIGQQHCEQGEPVSSTGLNTQFNYTSLTPLSSFETSGWNLRLTFLAFGSGVAGFLIQWSSESYSESVREEMMNAKQNKIQSCTGTSY